MREEVLPPGRRRVLDELERVEQPELKGWTLAGGTGLALLLGHRVSEDFDFFRVDPIDLQALHGVFRKIGKYETLQDEKRTLTVQLREAMLSFFVIGDPFIFPAAPYRFFSVADIRDIALMKIVAISGRGSRKDFVDLYRILQEGLTLPECWEMFPRKYGGGRGNRYHILKSLTWFEDAEKEPIPRMLEPFDWDACKAFFLSESKKLIAIGGLQ